MSFFRTVALIAAIATTGCSAFDRPPRVERWPSVCYKPMNQASVATPHASAQGHLRDEVTVYGYAEDVQLHFSLRDTCLAELLDAAGGLPRFGGRGRTHLGVVRAHVDLPGGEGYAFDFRNWRRRDALTLLADVSGRAIVVGPDVQDTIDVEVSGVPPIAVLRLLSDEGGVVILEDSNF
jgi:hypothetical protein